MKRLNTFGFALWLVFIFVAVAYGDGNYQKSNTLPDYSANYPGNQSSRSIPISLDKYGRVYIAPSTTGADASTSYPIYARGDGDMTLISAGPHILDGFKVCNNQNTGSIYVRLFDLSRAPTPADSPKIAAIMVSTTSCQDLPTSKGILFSNGLAFDITGDYPNGDATAITAGGATGSIFYRSVQQ